MFKYKKHRRFGKIYSYQHKRFLRTIKSFAMNFLISLIFFVVFITVSNCHLSQDIKRTFRTREEKKHFREWRSKHGKQYRSQFEEEEVMERILKVKEEIDAHNKLYDEGKVTYKQGLWEHSDWSKKDREKYLLGVKVPKSARSAPASPSLPQYPPGASSVDWRKEGLVGPVGNQGACGSCWAFSAAGVIESVLRRRKNNETVAPQQMVDCSTYGCWGCSSGWPKYALDYIVSNGIANMTEYPYVAHEQTCEYSKNMSIGYINKTYEIPTRGELKLFILKATSELKAQLGNETWLRDIVGSVGPISVVLCLNDTFYKYKSGVYYQEGCGTAIMHAVLIVGYGTDSVGGDYWIIKNSWGQENYLC